MSKYIYKGQQLKQIHTGNENCDGCYFEIVSMMRPYPCCEKVKNKFKFPCNKDIIFIKK
jgi:hypothetical protein